MVFLISPLVVIWAWSFLETNVHEILDHLPRNSIVIDLGSGTKSFDYGAYQFVTVRVDIDRFVNCQQDNSVQADAAQLPFTKNTIHSIVANHSLEHFHDLQGSLNEIRRVLKSQAALFVSVPDSTTITDRLYRWLAEGGGHVNAFQSCDELITRIESSTGLSNVGARPLYSSLSFLNRRNHKHKPPRRLLLLGGGNENILLLINYLFRFFDRYLKTRFSQYGWALYFGNLEEKISNTPWPNVCVRCGSGHPFYKLLSTARPIKKWLLFPAYECPHCGALNLFTRS